MNITVFGKRITHLYHHYIMKIDLDQFKQIKCDGYWFRSISEDDFEILKKGDFSLPNMTPYLRKEKKYSTGLLFFEDKANNPVGYIWVIRRGGNEMSYRIRNIDALISCVCVFKDYRGRNIANLMISEVVNILKAENCNQVALGVNTNNNAAIITYIKSGFRIVEEKKYFRVLRINVPYHII